MRILGDPWEFLEILGNPIKSKMMVAEMVRLKNEEQAKLVMEGTNFGLRTRPGAK